MIQTNLETDRLLINGFTPDDLPVIHRILDQTFGDGSAVDNPAALAECKHWLQWQILSYEWFPKIYQPPYGDAAVRLKATGALIGSAGYVPQLDVYDQIPELRETDEPCGWRTTEFGLYWVIDPQHQRRGYASEAARALLDHAFQNLRLKRVIATTAYDNLASQAVMQKIGMTVTRNPQPEPEWLQIVGIAVNPALRK